MIFICKQLKRPVAFSAVQCEDDKQDASLAEELQGSDQGAAGNASSASVSSQSSSTLSEKSVSFSPQLVVRTHALVVGCHLACPLLPLQLDWQCDIALLDMNQCWCPN